MIYGQCHPKIDEILKPYPAALMDCQNCVDAFITRKAVEKKATRGSFLLSLPRLAGCLAGYIQSVGLGCRDGPPADGLIQGIDLYRYI